MAEVTHRTIVEKNKAPVRPAGHPGQAARPRLTVRQKLGFGIFDLGGNMLFTLMGFWCLNYLTDTVGLAAAWAGAAVMVGKVWDAVTDPMMGFISDRTRSRWGRRRPYLLFGAVPMMLTMWFFFTTPHISNTILLAVWAGLSLMAVNTASTIINIPYSSLTPELTSDYHEQTSLNGYRFGCAVFGTIIGAAAVMPIVGLFSSRETGFSMMGLILGAITALVTLLTFFGTREKPHAQEDLPTKGFFETYSVVFRNKPYVLLIITYGFHMMGITFLQTILAYYTNYIYPEAMLPLMTKLPIVGGFLHDPGIAQLKELLTTLSMLLMLLLAMCFIPVSVMVAKKIGKKRTYQICFVIIGSAGLIVSLVGHLLTPGLFLCLLVYAGIGVGFSYVAPFAMVPETVEYDAVRTGERKEGSYYGMWTFVSKLGMALAMFVSGQILAHGGYAAHAVQTETARLAIRLIIGPLPAVIFAVAIIIIQRYPLDEKTYTKLLKRP
jgi:GPH family glycoside/pentoside/hexuronide:cation symporter